MSYEFSAQNKTSQKIVLVAKLTRISADVVNEVTKHEQTDFHRARDKYLQQAKKRGLSPASVTSYRRHIDRFSEFLSKQRKRRKITDIRPNDLEAFSKFLAKNDFSPTTCAQSRSILEKWLRFLAHAGEVDTKVFPAGSGRRRKWSEDKIVAARKKLHRQGVAISYPGLRRAGHGNLTNAACRYFGSLTAARTAAGIEGR